MPNWDTPARIDSAELIDDDDQRYEDIRASMKDVQRANRLLGGVGVVAKTASMWLKSLRTEGIENYQTVTFLDIATGSGDLPVRVLKIARNQNVAIKIIGLDYSSKILRFAREEVGDQPTIILVRGSAYRLPFADSSVDYVMCSLAFHHFGPEGCVAALTEMERVSRRGWLVNDLRRAWSAWFLFRIVSRITGMHRITQHDGPASILRAYSCAEYLDMPRKLGLLPGKDFELKRSLWYRVALIRTK